MRHHTLNAAIAAITSITLTSTAARADEAYVCDVGRVVYVKPGELEHLKRTDPCIAGYYGLAVEKNPALPSASQGAVSAGSGLSLMAVGKAVKGLNMERAARRQLAAPTPVAAPADLKAPVATRIMKTSLIDASFGSKRTVDAAPGADFRNVVIINAAAGKDKIYRHER